MDEAGCAAGHGPSPLVTVGLPVYNGGDHLALALDCLRGQSYRNLEIIVSDNGSTDGTRAICETAAAQDTRVRYHRHDRNRGPYWNFAFVLREARGPLFMWAGHDDLWDNGWIGGLVGAFRADTSIAFGRLRRIGPADGMRKDFPDQAFEDGKALRLARYILAAEEKGKANLVYGLHQTAVLRERAISILESGWDVAGVDMLIVFCSLEKGRAVSTPEVRFYKRARPAVARRRGSAGLLRALAMWDRLSYVWACLRVAEGLASKIVISALLPVKYLQALFRSARAIVSGHR
jgi:glycosyltransferase involved in cell wall biosynthesis